MLLYFDGKFCLQGRYGGSSSEHRVVTHEKHNKTRYKSLAKNTEECRYLLKGNVVYKVGMVARVVNTVSSHTNNIIKQDIKVVRTILGNVVIF